MDRQDEAAQAEHPHLADRVLRAARGTLRYVVDTILPHRCAGCGIIVPGDGGFCPDCWSKLGFISGPACARCDMPFPSQQGEGALCGACIADPPPYSRVRTALAYDDVTRSIVMRLKYGGKRGMARLMARMMIGVAPPAAPPVAPPDTPPPHSSDAADRPPLLVPVPLHRWRLWLRGFNQSVEVARHIADARGYDLAVDALQRTRRTPPLRGLGRAQRARTVKGAFSLSPRGREAVAGRRVLLVDDVFTTGATAAACARTLLRGGAEAVEVLAFARVLDDPVGQATAADIDSAHN